jgi:phage shock protein PspC (stress-responsive transcriptional regulator)
MKKTITINISGVIFNIEEEAYDILRGYLDRLSKNFTDSDGREEIMGDIESRIAELFQVRLGDKKEVVSDSDVKHVMDTMGKPEDFGMEAEEEQPKSKSYSTEHGSSAKRRVYRDTDKSVIGGVCSGISHYFGWDPLVVRLILLVLFLGMGFGFLLYIILWIIIPAAKTTAEKLEMRGEPVTVENIKKKVTETLNNFTVSNKMDGEFHQHARSQAGKASDALVDVLGRLFGFIGGVLGFFFLMVGLILVTIVLCTWYDPTILQFGNDTWNMQWAEVNGLIFDSRSQGNMFFAGAMAVGIIPVIGLILLGAKLLFRWDIKGKPVVPALIALWLIGLGLLVVTGISLGKEFSQPGEYVEIGKRMSSEVPLTMHIANGEAGQDIRSRNHWVGNFPEEYIEVDGERIIGHYPRIDISVNEESLEYVVKIYKKARGFTMGSGDQRAENIEYPFSFSEQNELILSPVFTAPLKDRFRGQHCEIEILIPVGQRIYISEEVQNFLGNVMNPTYYSRSELVGKEWLMTPEGLVLSGSMPLIEVPEEEI